MTEDKNLNELVSGLTKFLQWQDEYNLVMSHLTDGDMAGELMDALGIPSDEIRVLIGGSNAPIFKRASDEIFRLRYLLKEIDDDPPDGMDWNWHRQKAREALGR